ncbi:uncharacterized protein ACNS7B_000243 [Menidia menidia]
MTLQPTSFPDLITVVLNGDNTNTNGTECPDSPVLQWLTDGQPVYILIVSVLGIIFNLFVLMVFIFHKKPCTVAEIYLSNLAAADLMLVSCLPFWAVNIYNDFNWPFGQFMCKVVNVGIKINVYSSIYFLVLVSMDRYVALVHAMSHGRMRRSKYAKLSCLLTWSFGLLLSIPTFIFRGVKHFPEYGVHACHLEYPSLKAELAYDGMFVIFSFIFPISIISFCTFKIIQALGTKSIERCNAEKTEKKATNLVLIVLLAFVICWVPFHLVTILDLLYRAEVLGGCDLTSALDVCHQIFTYTGFFNSVLNPILYVIVGKNFQKKVQELFKQWSITRTKTAESTRSNLSSTLKTLSMEQITWGTAALTWSENNSTSSPLNSTESPLSAEWGIVHTFVPPYIFIISLFGLFFNSFVLAVFIAHKDSLTVAEIYLSNLALADLILLCGLPFWAMNILNGFHWPYGDALCKLVSATIVINFYTSIYSLVMISIDRYLALVKTMRARWFRRTLYAKIICLILWMLGILLALPTIVHRKVKFFEEYDISSCVLDYAHDSSWKVANQIAMNILGFVAPLLVIVFSSWNIVRALAQRGEGLRCQDGSDTKATVLVYAVTLLFLLCWGPFQVFTFLDTLCDVQVLDETLWFHTLDVGSQISSYLAFLNSTLNPLLYVFSGQYFRRKVCAVYRRARHQRRGSDMTTYQRSVVSTYVNRTEQIKPVVIFNAKEH